MKEKLIIVMDLSYFAYRSIFTLDLKTKEPFLTSTDDQILFMRKLLRDITNSYKKVLSYFQNEYKDVNIVLAKDSISTWRRKYFKKFKGTRKNTREQVNINWDKFYNLLDLFAEYFLKNSTNLNVITFDGYEGDDIIAKITQYNGADKIIIANDEDLFQLLYFNEVNNEFTFQFSPNSKNRNLFCTHSFLKYISESINIQEFLNDNNIDLKIINPLISLTDKVLFGKKSNNTDSVFKLVDGINKKINRRVLKKYEPLLETKNHQEFLETRLDVLKIIKDGMNEILNNVSMDTKDKVFENIDLFYKLNNLNYKMDFEIDLNELSPFRSTKEITEPVLIYELFGINLEQVKKKSLVNITQEIF